VLAAEIISGGQTARAFGSDTADPGVPERLIDDVEAAPGPVDVLVANHGLARPARYDNVDASAFDYAWPRPVHLLGGGLQRWCHRFRLRLLQGPGCTASHTSGQSRV
jgi:NAD(P)-dependent dehydrogenase (short-subunit alcohol dehydrogenase family)